MEEGSEVGGPRGACMHVSLCVSVSWGRDKWVYGVADFCVSVSERYFFLHTPKRRWPASSNEKLYFVDAGRSREEGGEEEEEEEKKTLQQQKLKQK